MRGTYPRKGRSEETAGKGIQVEEVEGKVRLMRRTLQEAGPEGFS